MDRTGVCDLQQFLELIYRQSSVTHNSAEGKCAHGIVTWNRENAQTVRHDNMFALAHDCEACLLEGAHRIAVIDALNLDQG